MIDRLVIPLKYIWNHRLASRNRPLAFWKFVTWQLRQAFVPGPVLVKFVEQSRLLVTKGMKGATGNIYNGLVEFEDMAFILHVLRPGDLFVDVGANVGAYTILASKNAGAKTVAFEPSKSSFLHLVENVNRNDIGHLVDTRQCGAGATKSRVYFTKELDTVNHVVLQQGESDSEALHEVEIITLNEYFTSSPPQVMKIDVEGFEWNVLSGATNLLASPDLKAIVIELNGSGMRYGFPDEQVHQLLSAHLFRPFSYQPFDRTLTSLETYGSLNTIYIKDLNWVQQRIQNAQKFKVLGNYF